MLILKIDATIVFRVAWYSTCLAIISLSRENLGGVQ